MRTLTIALFTAALLSTAVAGDTPEDKTPKSPAALSALAKLANAQDAAKKAYDKALKDAADASIKELEQIRAQVMKSGGSSALDEANRIQSSIDAVGSATAGVISSDGLARRLVNTRWHWMDDSLGDRAWFVFKADGTIQVGWHKKPTIWTASDGKILTKLGASNRIQSFTFAPDLSEGQARDDEGDTRMVKRLR